MSVPQDDTISEVVRKMREEGRVPLGIIAFHIEKDEFTFAAFAGVEPSEVNAMFERIGITVNFK